MKIFRKLKALPGPRHSCHWKWILNVRSPLNKSLLLPSDAKTIKMTLRSSLDDVDLKILEIITQNARIPFKDVAREVGISRAAVHQRVNRMIEMQVIVGSGYHINPTKVDFKTCSYIGIYLEKGDLFSEVVEKLR